MQETLISVPPFAQKSPQTEIHSEVFLAEYSWRTFLGLFFFFFFFRSLLNGCLTWPSASGQLKKNTVQLKGKRDSQKCCSFAVFLACSKNTINWLKRGLFISCRVFVCIYLERFWSWHRWTFRFGAKWLCQSTHSSIWRNIRLTNKTTFTGFHSEAWLYGAVWLIAFETKHEITDSWCRWRVLSAGQGISCIRSEKSTFEEHAEIIFS